MFNRKKSRKIDLAPPPAAEAPKQRTVAEIQTQYQEGCIRAGHLQYQIYTLGKDLELLNQTLRDLNFEAAKAKQANADAAASEALAETDRGVTPADLEANAKAKARFQPKEEVKQ